MKLQEKIWYFITSLTMTVILLSLIAGILGYIDENSNLIHLANCFLTGSLFVLVPCLIVGIKMK